MSHRQRRTSTPLPATLTDEPGFEKGMRMFKVVVTLDEEDLVELQRILMDGDEPASLRFLETCIAPKLPEKGTAACDSSRLNPYLLRRERGT